MSNPFWDFSLTRYALDEVPPACLALQDEFDLDVNVLLYGAWVAVMDQCLTVDHLEQMEVIIEPWRRRVVRPLRALRRQWRDYPGESGIRSDIKALELKAERQQQDMMLQFYRGASELPAAPQSLRKKLELVAQVASPDTTDWVPAIARLASRLGS